MESLYNTSLTYENGLTYLNLFNRKISLKVHSFPADIFYIDKMLK